MTRLLAVDDLGGYYLDRRERRRWQPSGRPWLARLLYWLVVAMVIGSATLPITVTPADAAPAARGYDVSWPQCVGGLPAAPGSVMIVGATGGRPFTENPCFADEYAWASRQGIQPALYLNLDYPRGSGAARGQSGPRGACLPHDETCRAYNYGANAAIYAEQLARSHGIVPSTWWLDVETANYWSPNPALNAQVIQGAVDALRSRGRTVGLYSVAFMWERIAGSYAPGLPNWVAQTNPGLPPRAYCSPSHAFGGGVVSMVQSWDAVQKLDLDLLCEELTGEDTSESSLLRPGGAISGVLVGSPGGASVSVPLATIDRPSWTLTVDFSPSGPDVANAFFVEVSQNGGQLVSQRASAAATPGQLRLTIHTTTSGGVVRLISYNRATTPPLRFTVRATTP